MIHARRGGARAARRENRLHNYNKLNYIVRSSMQDGQDQKFRTVELAECCSCRPRNWLCSSQTAQTERYMHGRRNYRLAANLPPWFPLFLRQQSWDSAETTEQSLVIDFMIRMYIIYKIMIVSPVCIFDCHETVCPSQGHPGRSRRCHKWPQCWPTASPDSPSRWEGWRPRWRPRSRRRRGRARISLLRFSSPSRPSRQARR